MYKSALSLPIIYTINGIFQGQITLDTLSSTYGKSESKLEILQIYHLFGLILFNVNQTIL